MWKMLQHPEPEDFVLATGETHTVRKFVELTFAQLGIEIEWRGEAENEKGIVSAIKNEKLKIKNEENPLSNLEFEICNLQLGDVVISIDPNYYRPTEVDLLIGDPSKAKSKLGWQAETKLEELVEIMVNSDLKKVIEKGY